MWRNIILNEEIYPKVLGWTSEVSPEALGMSLYYTDTGNDVEDEDLIYEIFTNHFDWSKFYNDFAKEYIDYLYKDNQYVEVRFKAATAEYAEVMLVSSLENICQYLLDYSFDDNYSGKSDPVSNVLDNIAQAESDRVELDIQQFLEDYMGNNSITEWIDDEGYNLLKENVDEQ